MIPPPMVSVLCSIFHGTNIDPYFRPVSVRGKSRLVTAQLSNKFGNGRSCTFVSFVLAFRKHNSALREIRAFNLVVLRLHPAVSGSNPKHTMYAFSIGIGYCTIFINVLNIARK